MTREQKWWAMAQQLCPQEYDTLTRVLSEQNTGRAHDKRLARARKNLAQAMGAVTEKQWDI